MLVWFLRLKIGNKQNVYQSLSRLTPTALFTKESRMFDLLCLLTYNEFNYIYKGRSLTALLWFVLSIC